MNQPKRNCVLLADRYHGLTEGMRELLKTSFETVVMVADPTSLFDSTERLGPNLAVIDLSLSSGGGLDLITKWHGRFPEVRLIVLSIHDEATVARTVIDAGANAFVLKRTIATDLLDAVGVVSSGEIYVSSAIGELSASRLQSPRERILLRPRHGNSDTPLDGLRRQAIRPEGRS